MTIRANVCNGWKAAIPRFRGLERAGGWPIENRPLERGIGCASIIPAGFIGAAGLADYAGPTGWRGISEFLGWAVVCIAVGFGVGLLLSQWRRNDWRRYAAVPVAVAVAVAFTYTLNWLGLGAPMVAKIMFTTSLQIIGSLAIAGLIAGFGYIFWTEHLGR